MSCVANKVSVLCAIGGVLSAVVGAVRADDNLGSALDVAQREIGVELTNATSESLSLCVAYHDYELNTWITEGFWTIKPQATIKLAFRASEGSVYYRANGEFTWGDEKEFWISEGQAFAIKAADSQFPSFANEHAKLNYDSSVGMVRAKFSELPIDPDTDTASTKLVINSCDKTHYAAIAYSLATKKHGWAHAYHSRAEAEQSALSRCQSDDAKVVGWSRAAWLVLVRGDGNSYGCAHGTTKNEATTAALAECAKHARGGKVVVAIHSDQP